MKSRERRDREFSDYVARRSPALARTAFLLCGDRHRADDLVQITLTKLYVAWDRARKADSLDAYARRVLVRVSIDEARRPWRQRETVSDSAVPQPGHTLVEHPFESPVFEELQRLPPGQRAAVVLRYWHDLSVEETAELLDCSKSTVKTHCARGLERLRDALTTNAEATGATHD